MRGNLCHAEGTRAGKPRGFDLRRHSPAGFAGICSARLPY